MEHHHNVSSLVNDLVEMATATKRLPELERELQECKRIIERDGATIARLELKLQDRAIEIDDLRAKLRSVEAERDDAGFRQLEAEDRAGNAVAALTSMQATVVETLASLKGDGRDQMVRMTKAERQEWNDYLDAKAAAERKAKEEAERSVEPILDPGSATPHIEPASPYLQGQSVADPTASSTTGVDTGTPLATAPAYGASTTSDATMGQREPDPTLISPNTPSPLAQPSESFLTSSSSGVSVSPDPTASQPTSLSETAPDTSAPSQAGVATGKYSGKRYADWPYYVEESSWVANGGTHESYWEDREQFRKPSVA
jgi:hypothetical protein